MCDPLTLGAMVLGGAGQLYAGFGASAAGRLQAKMYLANAAILREQAGLAREEAKFSLKRGAYDAGRMERATDFTESAQTGFFQGGGINPAAGSPLMLQASTAAQGAIDAELIRSQAQLDYAAGIGRAAQITAQAAGQSMQAAVAQQKGADALIAAMFGAGATFLGGAAKMWPGLGGASAGAGASGKGFMPAQTAPQMQQNPWMQIVPHPERLGILY